MANAIEAAMIPREKPETERYYTADRVRRSLGHFLLGRGIASVASVAVAILLVRELPVVDYAGYTAISGLLIVLMVISSGGLERVVPRYFPELRQAKAESELKSFCWSLLLLRLVFLVVFLLALVIAYPPIRNWLKLPADNALMWAFVLYTLMFGMGMHLSRSLQALLLQRSATTGLAVEWFSKLAILLAWLFYHRQLSLFDAVWIQGSTAALGNLYMLVALHRHFAERHAGAALTRNLDSREIFSMGWHNYLQSLTGLHVGPPAGKLAAAYFLPSFATASLGFAYTMISVLQRYLPASLLLGLIEPTIMAKYSESRDSSQMMRFVSIVLKLNLFILIPATVWFCIAGRPLVEWVTDGKYGDSTWLIAALMVFLMLESSWLVLQLVANAVGKSELMVQSNLWSLFLVPAAVGLILIYGLWGLMGGVIGINMARNMLLTRRLRSAGHPYRPDWPGIGKILVVAIAASAISVFLAGAIANEIYSSLTSGILAISLFLAIAYAWKPFSASERLVLHKVIGKPYFVW